jgi:uncharacterized damage-inducible protein DinB
MDSKERLTKQLKTAQQFFNRTIGCFEEADSSFAPKEEMFTVAGQVAHTAQTIDWFVEGAFTPEGFDLDFEKHAREAKACTSLDEAKAWFDRATENAVKVLESKSDGELQEYFPEGSLMAGSMKLAIVAGIADHNAHHRGSLAVYARLLGKVPPMPYM